MPLATAWAALNKIDVIWKSYPADNLKRSFFPATVESVLMYGVTALDIN